MEAGISIMKEKDCAQKYKNVKGVQIDRKWLCAAEAGIDTCQVIARSETQILRSVSRPNFP